MHTACREVHLLARHHQTGFCSLLVLFDTNEVENFQDLTKLKHRTQISWVKYKGWNVCERKDALSWNETSTWVTIRITLLSASPALKFIHHSEIPLEVLYSSSSEL